MQSWYEFRGEIPLNTVRTWYNAIMENTKWQFTGWTGLPKEPYRHWCSYAEPADVIHIWNCINPLFKDEGFNLTPERIILNLYNHGDSSWLHKDSDKTNEWTAVVFLNDYWDVNWAGEMVLVEDNEVVKSFSPTPGKVILFKSNMLHGARPVSREAAFPRLGIAFQCKNDTNV